MRKYSFPKNMKTNIEMVTPQMARELLKRNVCNRPLITKNVKPFRREMELGRWEINDSGIAIDSNDNLSDGQTRLTALAKAKVVSVPMIVIRGVKPTISQQTSDTGSARTLTQSLQIAGIGKKDKTSSFIASAGQNVILHETSQLHRIISPNHVLSIRESFDFVAENREYFETRAKEIKDMFVSIKWISKNVLLTIYALGSQIDHEKTLHFLRILANREGGGEKCAAEALKRVLSKDYDKPKRSRLYSKTKDLYSVVFYCFNKFMNDVQTQNVVAPSTIKAISVKGKRDENVEYFSGIDFEKHKDAITCK